MYIYVYTHIIFADYPVDRGSPASKSGNWIEREKTSSLEIQERNPESVCERYM